MARKDVEESEPARSAPNSNDEILTAACTERFFRGQVRNVCDRRDRRRTIRRTETARCVAAYRSIRQTERFRTREDGSNHAFSSSCELSRGIARIAPAGFLRRVYSTSITSLSRNSLRYIPIWARVAFAHGSVTGRTVGVELFANPCQRLRGCRHLQPSTSSKL